MGSHERFRRALVALAFVLSAALCFRLPVSVPPQWTVPAWLVRLLLAFLLPAVAGTLDALFARLAAADRRGPVYAKFRSTYDLTLDAAILFVVGLHLTLLATLLGGGPRLGVIPPLLLGTALVGIGNALPRLRPNAVLGVRTPWTLADERVWARTHRVFCYLVVGWGLAILTCTALAPAWIPRLVLFGVPAAVAVAFALAFLFSRAHPGGARRQDPAEPDPTARRPTT